MTNGATAIISSVFITFLSAAGLGGFKIYTDVELLKLQTTQMERSMDEREETTKRFTAMMLQMDKTLAVQTEAVNTLKDAVKRLETRNGYAYNYKETVNDSRN